MLSKHTRQQAILRLVRDQLVGTQTDLVRRLAAEGITVNQSTISRDIKALGLIKAQRPGAGYGYAVPNNFVALTERSLRILREFVNSVDGSGALAVVHTDSGNAHPVAEAIDRLSLESVVGTVAGENTLLIVLREGVSWRDFREELEEWLQ